MKNIFKFTFFSILTICNTVVLADVSQNNPDGTQNYDPTVVFFKAVQSCTPGNYQQKNILSTNEDDAWLNHQIAGMDEQGYCHVILGTPDTRRMDCYFDPYDLADLGTPRFLSGMQSLERDPSSKAGVAAEHEWSQLRDQNCGMQH
jgi:hypothetical protein